MTILVQPSRSLTQIVTWEHGQSFLVQSSKVSHSVQLFEKESGLQDRLVTDGATFPWLPGAGRDAGRFVVGRCPVRTLLPLWLHKWGNEPRGLVHDWHSFLHDAPRPSNKMFNCDQSSRQNADKLNHEVSYLAQTRKYIPVIL